MANSKLILIEFNELCPHLLERWMAEERLPNFSRFFHDAAVFTTQADAEPPALEPWIQWYSLHTGVPYERHKVFTLTDGPRAGFEDIWTALAKRQVRVGNFSSMNARAFSSPGSVYLPDPWCTTQEVYPEELGTFYRFVSAQVQNYTNPNVKSQLMEAAGFLSFLVRHGLRMKTVMAVARQLIDERTSSKPLSWRRATLLDRIQFDIFRHYFRKNDLQFATFFSNSTAHFQHSYWRHMEPEKFAVKPAAEELDNYRDAILYGYQRMDDLLGDFFQLEAKHDATLVLATALSQQAYLSKEEAGGQHFYKPKNINALLARLGLAPLVAEPVMTHQFKLRFADAGQAQDARATLEGILFEGKPAFYARVDDDTDVFFACGVSRAGAAGMLEFAATGEREPFADWLFQIEGIKSGCHHPDGVFWVKSGRHAVFDERIPVTDVYPTILDYFGVAGDGQLAGRSVWPLAAARAA